MAQLALSCTQRAAGHHPKAAAAQRISEWIVVLVHPALLVDNLRPMLRLMKYFACLRAGREYPEPELTAASGSESPGLREQL